MTSPLYELLPAVYRERDAAEGYPLRALLRIVTDQADVLERDVERLYDDFFVETCRPWVLPYIGDLVGNDVLYDARRSAGAATAERLFSDLEGPDLRPPVAAGSRADVAKTISYRRRKGTPAMLEELARDVTGWPAHVVEFLDLVGWTQHAEHRRPAATFADVRNVERIERADGPFDETSHTADVRAPRRSEGWHHPRNVGLFLWRVGAFPLENIPARVASKPWRFHFSPLGSRAPLFARRRRVADGSRLAGELDVPGPIRVARFHRDLEDYRAAGPGRPEHTELYGLPSLPPGVDLDPCDDCSFFLLRNGEPVTPAVDPDVDPDELEPQIVCRRLHPWPQDPPEGRVVAVDVEAGRLAVGDGWPDATDSLDVSFHYGAPAALGGGPYERGPWLVRPDLAELRIGVAEDGVLRPGAPDEMRTSVADALALWSAEGRPNAIISILDSRTYELPSPLVLRNEGWLAIEAANGQRPLLRTPRRGVRLDADPPVRADDPDRAAALTLSGVVVEGFLHLVGDLGLVRLLHATLVPGRLLRPNGAPFGSGAAVRARGTRLGERINTQLRVEIAFSVSGELAVPGHADGVWILDSVVDGVAERALGAPRARPGPRHVIERSTIFGETLVEALEASESIFTEDVTAERTQDGCVRFSYVPAGSKTPRRHRCQPDLAEKDAPAADRPAIRARVVPSFTDRRYGQPAFAQLHPNAPVELRTGAEDGSEMGAHSHLKGPQRESNLRTRLDEYLPFGLEAGIVYVT